MKLIFLLQTLILVTVVFGHKKINFKRTPKDLSILERLKQNPDRNLANITPQKMRIKYDVSALNSIDDPKDKDFLIKTVQFAAQFFQDLIEVKQPIISPFKILETNKTCNGIYHFSNIQMNTEYKDADLVIFTSFVDGPNEPYQAFAHGCQQDQNTGRFIIGLVTFNLEYVRTSNEYQFQNLLQTTIHELFHVIVFDGDLFQFFTSSDGNLYDKSKYNTLVLKTPNVVKWAQEYYGCKTAEGMQLENTGSSGVVGHHWETSILKDDIMSGTPYDVLWSGVNNALLLDSGWYEVNLKYEDNLTWGKNKGCGFLKDKCNSDIQFKEFCKGEGQDTSFNYHVKGYCRELEYEPECRILDFEFNEINGVVKNTICNDPSNQDSDGKYYEYYGYDSRAFLSTLKPISEKPIKQACYKYKCTNSNTQIQVMLGEEILTCSQSGKKLKSSSNLIDGELTCPDIKDFCQKQSFCPNYCGTNGYCISGKCICQNGFSGEGCECEEGKVNKNGQCVNCDENCTLCSSSDPKKCSACKTGFFLQGEQCHPCKSPCKTCSTDESTCLSCISNFYLSNKSCEQFTSDPNCDIPEDNSKCKFCKPGKGLDSDGKCNLTCSNNCQTCSQQADVCTSCNVGNILFNNQCVCEDGYFMNQSDQCEKCMAKCKECVNAQTCIQCIDFYVIDENTSKCSICLSGYFLQNEKCEKCSENCQECEGQSTNCIQCFDQEILYGQNGSKSCKCEQNFVYNSENVCTKCTVGGCSLCEKADVCSKCDAQYKLNESKGICEFEERREGSSECKQGEYMNDKNSCVSCDMSCNDCEEQKISCQSFSNKFIYSISFILLFIILF